MRLPASIVACALAGPALAGGFSPIVAEQPPVVAPAVQAPAASVAAGWYAFGAIGAVSGTPEYTYEPDVEDEDNVTDVDLSGAIVSLGVGRELLSRGGWTLGAEVDISGGNVNSDVVVGETTPCIIEGEGCTAELNWLATARGVAGWRLGATTPFVTAGFAVGDVSGTADSEACDASECVFDETRTGWVAGIGIRHELSNTWAVKGEVLYTDLGSPSFTEDSVTGDFSFALARIGVVRRF